MNKIMSRNLVQRFKEGRKIEKFKTGGFTYNGKHYVGGGTKIINWINSQNQQKRVGMNGKPIIDNYSNVTQQDPSVKQTTSVSDYSWMKGGTRQRTPEEQKKWKAEKQRQQNLIKNDTRVSSKVSQSKPSATNKKTIPSSIFAGHKIGKTGGLNYSNSINDADKQQLIRTGQFTESDFANALATQQALNRYFANSGLGSVTEDGAWGDQSRFALQMALNKSKSLTPFNNETTIVKTPVLSTYTSPTTPVNQEIANLKLNIPTYINANRSETRDWMRSNNINPYSVTGAMRAAARRIRAGQGNNNDKLLVKGNEQLYNLLKGYYKQGGLISKSPIERFKSFRKEAQ